MLLWRKKTPDLHNIFRKHNSFVTKKSFKLIDSMYEIRNEKKNSKIKSKTFEGC